MKMKTIGLRREDGHTCERRAAIVPDDIKQLKALGFDVVVQPSNQRAFTNEEYAAAGAKITEDLSSANVIFGLKSIPVGSWLHEKTYAIFSHTHKSQKENMPSLREALTKNCRLIDYEFICNGKKRSLTQFGKWAGITGAIQGLHVLGLRMLALGFNNPFVKVAPSQCYSSYNDVVSATQTAVNLWNANPSFASYLGPLIVGITGEGNVGRGAKQFFMDSGFRLVEYSELSNCNSNSAYCVVFPITSTLVLRENKDSSFSESDCFSHPENFDSIFVERHLSKLSLFINAVYWEAPMPRLIQTKDLPSIIERGRPYVISDVSCDVEGSVEFLKCGMNIFKSWQLYNRHGNPVYSAVGDEKDLLAVTAIDNLPSLFARQASNDFSNDLMKYIPSILSVDISESHKTLPNGLADSVICEKGGLIDRFKSINV